MTCWSIAYHIFSDEIGSSASMMKELPVISNRSAAAMIPSVEVHSALGRSDLEAEGARRRWVFEFKFARESDKPDKLLEKALEQLQARRHGIYLCTAPTSSSAKRKDGSSPSGELPAL